MEPEPVYVSICENSMLARLGARKLKSTRCALVVHKTIYLWGISKNDFLNAPRYVRHELQHVLQYRRYGVAGFLIRYLYYSLIHGYYNNPLEVEARASEADAWPEGFHLSDENAPNA